jgi:hypothetical protein
MQNIAIDTLSPFETIDLDALQDVSGGDFADRWWNTLKTNATETLDRYVSAYKNYSNGWNNLRQGNFRQGANDIGNGLLDHGAGALDLLNTVKEAIPPLMPTPKLPA